MRPLSKTSRLFDQIFLPLCLTLLCLGAAICASPAAYAATHETVILQTESGLSAASSLTLFAIALPFGVCAIGWAALAIHRRFAASRTPRVILSLLIALATLGALDAAASTTTTRTVTQSRVYQSGTGCPNGQCPQPSRASSRSERTRTTVKIRHRR